MKKGSVLLIIIGVLVIVFGLVNPINLGKKENNQTNSNNKNNEEKKEDVPTTSFNGIYIKGKTSMKLFVKNNKLYFNIVNGNDGVASGDADISGNTAEGSIIDSNYKFTSNNNNIILETNNSSIESGEYTKNKEYTINDYYTDNYGDINYSTSEINGLYEQNNNKLYIYQINSTTISFIAEVGNNHISSDCQKDAKGIYVTSIFDNTYNIKIDKDTVLVTSTEKEFNGQYTKKQSLTIEEIINKF